ncbi:MAG: hypothetical protein AAGG79_00110 [Pseudomonadota bacterium]
MFIATFEALLEIAWIFTKERNVEGGDPQCGRLNRFGYLLSRLFSNYKSYALVFRRRITAAR